MPTLSRLAKLASGIAVIVFLGWLVMCNRADAQQSRCLPFKLWLDTLDSKYGERPAYIGSMGTNVMTITVNPETGTWTVLMQPNADVSCIMAAGKNWIDAPPAEPVEPPVVVPQIERMPGVRREYLYPAFFGPLPSY